MVTLQEALSILCKEGASYSEEEALILIADLTNWAEIQLADYLAIQTKKIQYSKNQA